MGKEGEGDRACRLKVEEGMTEGKRIISCTF